MLENVRFEFFFDGIRELHASVRKEFHAVVLIRIVRRGNNDAGLKIILADQAGHARSGDDASECDGGAGLLQASGEESSDVRAGFPGVHADQNASSGMFAEQKGGKRAASSEKSSVVERRSAGNAADAVGSEKFFGHGELAGAS